MSTSRRGHICRPKYSCKERRRDFSNHSSVEAAMSGRCCVILCESNRTAQPKYSNLCSTFYGQHFREPMRGQGWLHKGQKKKQKKKGSIPTLLWLSGASESATVSLFFISSSICYWLFKYAVMCVMRCVCVWVSVCVCVREQGHITAVCAARQKSGLNW